MGHPQVLLATGEGNLVCLDVREGRFGPETRVKLDTEVACVDISPLGDDGDASSLAAVGTWDMQACQLLLMYHYESSSSVTFIWGTYVGCSNIIITVRPCQQTCSALLLHL